MTRVKKVGNWVGKYFENEIMTPALTRFCEAQPAFFHKLKDTYAARNFLPTSPADYLVALSGEAQLWECKASAVQFSLRSCLSDMVSNHQVAHHRLWHRSGNRSWFLFYSDQTGVIEFWPGDLVVQCRLKGSPLPSGGEEVEIWHPDSLLEEGLFYPFKGVSS